MKPDEPRMPIKHALEHAVPTVIHDPEQDMNRLERWLRHAMENPVRFWGLLGALVVVLVGLSLLAGGLQIGKAASDEAWTKLETAKTPAERIEIAKDFPKTQAERWALLQAATEYYNQGFNDLPSNREVARPTLGKALETFQRVERESPLDTPQARAAALGVARTLEARNELDKAQAQYEKVAKAWPKTPEGRQAERLAAELKRPETAAFYKELYAYKPVEASLPAGGTGTLNLPLPPDHPPISGPGSGASSIPMPNPLTIPPPPPSPATKTEAPGLKTMTLIPEPAPSKTGASATDQPRPKTENPAPASDTLPADVFSPAKPEGAADKK